MPQAIAETSVDISNNGEGTSSEVHIENSVGESITCVNGSCTTTQNGGNSTTVCINGKCETTQGNVDRQGDGARVHVENNSNQSNPSIPSHTPIPSPTEETTNSAEASISARKDEASSGEQFSLEKMMNTIRNFFNELFS